MLFISTGNGYSLSIIKTACQSYGCHLKDTNLLFRKFKKINRKNYIILQKKNVVVCLKVSLPEITNWSVTVF